MSDEYDSNLERQMDKIIKTNRRFALKYTLYSIILFLGISYMLYRATL